MNGDILLRRVIETVQEIVLKIGDSSGSISLYYPAEDPPALAEELLSVASDFGGITAEALPGRIRVNISESESARISAMPHDERMVDVIGLLNSGTDIGSFRDAILSKYEGAVLTEVRRLDHDWVLTFPDDDNIYCLSEEFGRLTYHRFYRDEYLAFGYTLRGVSETLL